MNGKWKREKFSCCWRWGGRKIGSLGLMFGIHYFIFNIFHHNFEMVRRSLFRATADTFKLVESPESHTVLARANSPLSSISSATRESSSMVKASKDNPSPSRDSNSLSKSSKSWEVLEAEKSKLFAKKRRWPKRSPKAHWERPMLDKPADNPSPISRDTKSWCWGENSLSSPVLKPTKRNDRAFI